MGKLEPISENGTQFTHRHRLLYLIRLPQHVVISQNDRQLPSGFIQQSSVPTNGDLFGQLSFPQTKVPAHCLSLSQSPSPSLHGFDSVQHPSTFPLHPITENKCEPF